MELTDKENGRFVVDWYTKRKRIRWQWWSCIMRVEQLTKIGFIVKGPIPDKYLYSRLSKYRVHLAPLRFGAVRRQFDLMKIYSFLPTGYKRKDCRCLACRVSCRYDLNRCWRNAQRECKWYLQWPATVYPGSCREWGGIIADTEEDFISASLKLYTDEPAWLQCAKGMFLG